MVAPLFLTAPKAVEHLLLHHPEKIAHLYLDPGQPAWRESARLAKQVGIGIQPVAKGKGAGAHVFLPKPGGLKELELRMEERGFWLLLDRIQDPRNLGAICRSAEAFGCLGIVYPKDRAVPITEVVLQTSAGALATLPFYSVPNLGEVCRRFKKAGIWIATTTLEPNGLPPEQMATFDRVAGLLGTEGEGVGHLLQSLADIQVRIPTVGLVQSLNVSVAAAILCYIWQKKQPPHPTEQPS